MHHPGSPCAPIQKMVWKTGTSACTKMIMHRCMPFPVARLTQERSTMVIWVGCFTDIKWLLTSNLTICIGGKYFVDQKLNYKQMLRTQQKTHMEWFYKITLESVGELNAHAYCTTRDQKHNCCIFANKALYYHAFGVPSRMNSTRLNGPFKFFFFFPRTKTPPALKKVKCSFTFSKLETANLPKPLLQQASPCRKTSACNFLPYAPPT